MNYFTFFFSVESSKCSVYFTLRTHLHLDLAHFQVLNKPREAGGTVLRIQERQWCRQPYILRLNSQSNREKREKRYKTNNKHAYKKNMYWVKGRNQQSYVQIMREVLVITSKLQRKIKLGCAPNLSLNLKVL